MGKLILKDPPPFTAPVSIPLPGGGVADPVAFTFVHRSRAELDAFVKGLDAMSQADAVLAMCTGWDLDDAFGPEAVAELVGLYASAQPEIFRVYLQQLLEIRLGN